MSAADPNLLSRVASKLREPPTYAVGAHGSILAVTASSYGSQISEETQPTGFDPQMAALFEAVVESAFLVANADGDFDETERRAFQQVVLSACNEAIREEQVAALLADLADQYQEDGMDKRLHMVGRTIKKAEHAREVLRVAALLAHVSGGVSEPERAILGKLAREFELDDQAVSLALSEVESALSE